MANIKIDYKWLKIGWYLCYYALTIYCLILPSGIVKKCAVIEYPKSEIGIYQAA